MFRSKIILILLLFGFFIITTCKKVEKVMMVKTGVITNISTISAEISGYCIDLGEGNTFQGHCYSKTPNVSVSTSITKIEEQAVIGDYTSHLVNLEPKTKYYVKAYLSNGKNIVYGDEIYFTTDSLPTVISTNPSKEATNVPLNTSISATFNHEMDPSSITTLTYYLKDGETSVPGAVSYSGSTASFTPTNNLLAGKTYTCTITTSVKTLANISLSTDYIWTFGTQNVATTSPATIIQSRTATLNGIVCPNNLSTTVTFEYGTSISYGTTLTLPQSPVIGNSPISVSALVTSLMPDQLYHFRIKAINSDGTFYGDDLVFTTQNAYADLALSNVSFLPQTIMVGAHPDTISFRLANNGPENLTSLDTYVIIEIYLSQNTTFGDGDDIKIFEAGWDFIINSGTYTDWSYPDLNPYITIPPGVLGDYYVFFNVQPYSTLTDPNPLNNWAMRSRNNSYIRYNK